MTQVLLLGHFVILFVVVIDHYNTNDEFPDLAKVPSTRLVYHKCLFEDTGLP